jgi:hypothetical protein
MAKCLAWNLWNTTFSQFNRRGLHLIALIFSHQIRLWGLGVMPLYVVVEYGSIYLTINAFWTNMSITWSCRNMCKELNMKFFVSDSYWIFGFWRLLLISYWFDCSHPMIWTISFTYSNGSKSIWILDDAKKNGMELRCVTFWQQIAT